jgi:hypothetical protein
MAIYRIEDKRNEFILPVDRRSEKVDDSNDNQSRSHRSWDIH